MEALPTLREATDIKDLDALANRLVAKYNTSVEKGHPRMHSDIDGIYDKAQ